MKKVFVLVDSTGSKYLAAFTKFFGGQLLYTAEGMLAIHFRSQKQAYNFINDNDLQQHNLKATEILSHASIQFNK